MPFIGLSNISKTHTDSQTSLKDSTIVLSLNYKARKIISSHPEEAFNMTLQALELSKKITFQKGTALSLNGMGIASYYLGNYDKALMYYESALLVYKSLNDFLMEATIKANIGNIYHILGNYDTAYKYFKSSLEISIRHYQPERTATTLGSLGILYYDQAKYASALNVYLKTLKIRESLNDKQGIAYTFSNIGLIYDDQAQYNKALGYYKNAMIILKEIQDNDGLSATLNNMGLVYYNLNQTDTALHFFQESLNIATKTNNKAIIRSCYNNIGDIYKSKGDYKKATHYYKLTQEINAQLNDTKSEAITLNSIADLYKQQKDPKSAIQYFLKSLELSQLSGDRFMIKENHKNLASVYAFTGNYKLAYEHFLLYFEMNEELFRESQHQLADIQHLYESEKMRNEMRYLKQQKEFQDLRLERNRLIIYASFAGVALLVFILILIYRASRLKTKANEKLKLQNIIIAKQKHEIESEKQRADSQILEILKSDSSRLTTETSGASFDDYRMVAALFKKMESENLHSKIELLKSEVDPHFLFNSLNNLVSLIEENQAVAANYVQELSSVYLYVLRSKEKELVELADEMNFAHSYSFLLFRRFGNNLIFNMCIDEIHFKHYVPPLCLELLIENAVKHNIVTTVKPLTIDIYVDNNYLVVRNNLQPKNTAVTSTKVGLKNIEKRYALLCEKKIEIIKTKKDFIVKLPLIDLT